MALLARCSSNWARVAVAEMLAAPVQNLRQVARLPKSLQVRLATEDDLALLRRFVTQSARAAERLASGDQCVVAMGNDQLLATEWFKLGPAAYTEDVEDVGIVFRVPASSCWLYDGVSGEDGHALGPWGAVMGRLREYLEERQVQTAYLQIDYNNPYSIACHEALGFRVVGRLRCVTFGRWRFVAYKPVGGVWTPIHGGVCELAMLTQAKGSTLSKTKEWRYV